MLLREREKNMKYIETFREGERVNGIYLCKSKSSAVTKNGKSYDSLILQDKTGTIDSKIWDPNSGGIDDFDALDYIDVVADVTSFNGTLQLNVKRVRKASEEEYNPKDYLPVTDKDADVLYQQLVAFIESMSNPYLKQLCQMFFVEDEQFIKAFCNHSAAKSVHHGFIGGLLEHTVSVTKMCDYFSKQYTKLNRDLLLSAAMFHDMGKTKELSAIPINDYTDDGQLLGHIIIGVEMIGRKIEQIEGFPAKLSAELKHCILAHHGELEYGSPKKPALMEAVALNLADNSDAKLQTMTELLSSDAAQTGQWLGYNRLFESNIRMTSDGLH